MEQIKCPKCGEVFSVDDAHYAAILNQVRNAEFDRELKQRALSIEKDYTNQAQLAKAKADQEKTDALNAMKVQIADLQSKVENADSQRQLALAEQAQQFKDAQAKRNEEFRTYIDEQKQKSRQSVEALNQQIADLQSRLQNSDMQQQLAVQQVQMQHNKDLADKELMIQQLNGQVAQVRNEAALTLSQVKDQFALQLKDKDELIAYYKDMKTRLSTKMIGESLEQHCSNEFERMLRPVLRDVVFEKDNDASNGSKGDFIYREFADDGTEVLSIMFEMKNEADETATKHKNEDFFAKLDKDRNEKKCEYAVLVTLLEADSELYNQGIVDVSHRYEKMYVVRPQCFIPIITILRNAAKSAAEYKVKLAEAKAQHIDITNFEDKLTDFKDKFGKNVEQAKKKFDSAIDEIDKAIARLQAVKAALTGSSDYLDKANKKADDLTIRKLTWGNKTMQEAFKQQSALDKPEEE